MFGNVVLGIPRSLFEDELDDIKYEKGLLEDSDLTAEDLKELVGRFKSVYEHRNMIFPQDVWEQLRLSSKCIVVVTYCVNLKPHILCPSTQWSGISSAPSMVR
jgi:hypothetical protein